MSVWNDVTDIVSSTCIGGSRGGACRAHDSPLWDQILSFLHIFLPKSTHVGGPCPPNGSTPPPTGNPGSATDMCFEIIVSSEENEEISKDIAI